MWAFSAPVAVPPATCASMGDSWTSSEERVRGAVIPRRKSMSAMLTVPIEAFAWPRVAPPLTWSAAVKLASSTVMRFAPSSSTMLTWASLTFTSDRTMSRGALPRPRRPGRRRGAAAVGSAGRRPPAPGRTASTRRLPSDS